MAHFGVQIQFPGNQSGFAQAFARLIAALDSERLDETTRYGVELVFEEIVSNIIKYGAAGDREPDVSFLLDVRAAEIVLTFEDDGIPFDSSTYSARPTAKSLDDVNEGGHGLTLVRGVASSISYGRAPDKRNVLTIAVRRPLRSRKES
ncbi:MAG: ATP-binding protein [Steroidobacteraceae bacterium]|nr:ATP-binding protein [Steroidobacteraceae bacterium]